MTNNSGNTIKQIIVGVAIAVIVSLLGWIAYNAGENKVSIGEIKRDIEYIARDVDVLKKTISSGVLGRIEQGYTGLDRRVSALEKKTEELYFRFLSGKEGTGR